MSLGSTGFPVSDGNFRSIHENSRDFLGGSIMIFLVPASFCLEIPHGLARTTVKVLAKLRAWDRGEDKLGRAMTFSPLTTLPYFSILFLSVPPVQRKTDDFLVNETTSLMIER